MFLNRYLKISRKIFHKHQVAGMLKTFGIKYGAIKHCPPSKASSRKISNYFVHNIFDNKELDDPHIGLFLVYSLLL